MHTGTHVGHGLMTISRGNATTRCEVQRACSSPLHSSVMTVHLWQAGCSLWSRLDVTLPLPWLQIDAP